MTKEIQQTTVSDKSWESGLDLVRVFAAILVISVHCNFYFAEAQQGVASPDWLFSCIIASFSRICVPLFFMLSGCLLIKPGLQPISFYRKRLARVCVPLLFWSIVYLVVRVTLLENRISLLSGCRLLYNAEVYYHLGFLYALTALYLAIPFLSTMAEPGRHGLLVGFTALTFVIASLIPFADRLASESVGFKFSQGIPAGVFWIFAGYATLGALIGKEMCHHRKTPWMAAVLLIAATILTTSLTLQESLRIGKGSEKWFGYGEPAVFLAAAAFFALARSLTLSHYASVMLRTLGGWSFGVYLCHPLIIDLIRAMNWLPPGNVYWGLPVYIAVVCVFSGVLVAVLARMPLLRKVV